MPKRGIRRDDERNALAEWRGAQARLWSYVLTHRTLTIRLESEEREGNLHIEVSEAHVIQMPTVWFNANIEIFHDIGRDRFGDPMSLLIDRQADVRILCVGVILWENASPLTKCLYPKDFAPVLDQYMGVWRTYKIPERER